MTDQVVPSAARNDHHGEHHYRQTEHKGNNNNDDDVDISSIEMSQSSLCFRSSSDKHNTNQLQHDQQQQKLHRPNSESDGLLRESSTEDVDDDDDVGAAQVRRRASSVVEPAPPPHQRFNTPQHSTSSSTRSSGIRRNFVKFAALLAAIPASALACLGLATSRLGNRTGAWQSGILYLTYTLSSVSGATVVVSRSESSRIACVLGAAGFCVYILCFWMATTYSSSDSNDDDDGSNNGNERMEEFWAWTGAALGGVGAGILWTAQGVYFTETCQAYHYYYQQEQEQSHQVTSAISPATNDTGMTGDVAMTTTRGVSSAAVTAELGGIFAFWLLLEETILDALSTILTHGGRMRWSTVFGIYSLVAVASTVALYTSVDDPPSRITSPPLSLHSNANGAEDPSNKRNHRSGYYYYCHQMTAAIDLLINDCKTKYLIGFNTAFGWSGAFLNSFVSGQVVPIVLGGDSTYVGVLVAFHGGVAALASILFGRLTRMDNDSKSTRSTNCVSDMIVGKKGPVLILGCLCFATVALPFLIHPDLTTWTYKTLVLVYGVQGIGRATFEGSLRATFSDWFPHAKEGAFANIILQNGIATGLGYFISLRLSCPTVSTYCLKYRDGTLHNLWAFCWLVVGASMVAIVCYLRAARLYRRQQRVGPISATTRTEETTPERVCYDTILLVESQPEALIT